MLTPPSGCRVIVDAIRPRVVAIIPGMRIRIALTVALLIVAAPLAVAQQQDIFPTLSGEPLVEALVSGFTPGAVFGYDRARDSLFAAVYYEPGAQEGPGTVRCVYTDWPISIDLSSSTAPRTQANEQGVNTEHTWPQSLGAGSGPARSDLHHLYPTRADANTSRSNYPFADLAPEIVSRWWYLDQNPEAQPAPPLEIWSRTATSLPAFQPRDEHKGRVARAMFYFYTIYRDEAGTVDPFYMDIQKEVLYQWHQAFPPDSLEHARNQLIASYQDDKVNPFIADTSLVRRAYFSEPSGGDPFDAIYTFDGTTDCDNEDPGVSVQPEHVSFADFSREEVLCNQGAGTFNSRSWSTASSLDEGTYVEFSVTPNAGRQLVFEHPDRITFISRRSAHGPLDAELRLSIDGGDFVTLDGWELPGTGNVTNTFYLPSVSSAGSITFRFHGWNAESSAGTLRFDNVRITGRSVEAPLTDREFDGPDGWRMLSAPGSGMTVADLAAQNLVQGVPDYYPDAAPNLFTAHSSGSWGLPGGGSEPLVPGHGFIWYFWKSPIEAPGASQGVGLPFTLSFSGSPSQADVLVPLNGNPSGGSWTAVGNPFPFAIDLEGLPSWAQGGSLSSAVAQQWDPHDHSYVLLSGPDAVIEPWDAVMVENDDADSILFPLSAEAGRNAGSAAPGIARVAFELEGVTPDGQPRLDRAATIHLSADASDGWDLWDAMKLAPLAPSHVLLALEGVRDGQPVLKAQESRPWPHEPLELVLAASSQGIEGPVTLRWPQLDVPDEWGLTLTDLASGEVIDMREADAYVFTAASDGAPAGDENVLALPGLLAQRGETPPPTRFMVRIVPGTVSSGTPGEAAKLALESIYPNPARGPVHVLYETPSEGSVTLSVFDVLGRRVAVLVDGPQTAGRHEVRWDADRLAGGVYVVRLEAAGTAVTRKLVLVR